MHQDAFPGEDISDRPPPEASVPGLLALIEGELPSGRYRARELAPAPAWLHPGRARRGAFAGRGARPGPRRRAARRVPRGRRAHPPPLHHLPRLLQPGDVLVVSTSATLPAALHAHNPQGELRLHLSSPAPSRAGTRGGELRAGAERHRGGQAGDVLLLPGAPGPCWPSGGRRAPLAAAPAPPRAAAALPGAPRRADPLRPFRAPGRSRAIRRSTPTRPAAPRCRAPAAPSPPSS